MNILEILKDVLPIACYGLDRKDTFSSSTERNKFLQSMYFLSLLTKIEM